MTNIDIFSNEWNRQATNEETARGGIRMGPVKALGTSIHDEQPDDEETLQREEDMLRQKLTHQLAQMKEREADGREYLRKHGIVPELAIADSSRVYARH
jgi:hypothetical protein